MSEPPPDFYSSLIEFAQSNKNKVISCTSRLIDPENVAKKLQKHVIALDHLSSSDLKYVIHNPRFPTLFELDNYIQLFKLDESRTMMDVSKSGDPWKGQEFENYLVLRKQQNERWARHIVEEGILKAKEGDDKVALKMYKQAITVCPHYEEAYIARGALLANQGHYKEAISDFEKGLEINPSHVTGKKYLEATLEKHQSRQERDIGDGLELKQHKKRKNEDLYTYVYSSTSDMSSSESKKKRRNEKKHKKKKKKKK